MKLSNDLISAHEMRKISHFSAENKSLHEKHGFSALKINRCLFSCVGFRAQKYDILRISCVELYAKKLLADHTLFAQQKRLIESQLQASSSLLKGMFAEDFKQNARIYLKKIGLL